MEMGLCEIGGSLWGEFVAKHPHHTVGFVEEGLYSYILSVLFNVFFPTNWVEA